MNVNDENILTQVKKSWQNLPTWAKFLGYAIFIWGSVRAIPILAILATMLVYVVAIVFLIVCLCACDETVEALNRFQEDVQDCMNRPMTNER